MTPSADYRKGAIVVSVKRPDWTEPGSIYVQVRQDGQKGYSNVIEYSNLPHEVQIELGKGEGVVYWHVVVGDGKIQFKKQATREEWIVDRDTFVFDEDGEVQYDLLVDRLIDKCELDLRNPDNYRFNGVSDEQWEEIKTRAHEQINGRG